MRGSVRRFVHCSISTSDTLFIFGGIDMLISTVFVKYLGQRGVKMFSERLVSFHSRKTLDTVMLRADKFCLMLVTLSSPKDCKNMEFCILLTYLIQTETFLKASMASRVVAEDTIISFAYCSFNICVNSEPEEMQMLLVFVGRCYKSRFAGVSKNHCNAEH